MYCKIVSCEKECTRYDLCAEHLELFNQMLAIVGDAIRIELPELPLPTLITRSKQLNLTKREREVAILLAEGKKLHALSQTLGISVNTAKKHASSIYNKLGVRNRADVACAMREHS